jgi:hypothetical protein
MDIFKPALALANSPVQKNSWHTAAGRVRKLDPVFLRLKARFTTALEGFIRLAGLE